MIIVKHANGQPIGSPLQNVASLRLPASGTALPAVAVPIAAGLVAGSL